MNIPYFIRKLFLLFITLMFGIPHTFGRKNVSMCSELFVKEGLLYSWNFEFAASPLKNTINKEGIDGTLRKNGNVNFGNGIAQFYDNSSFLRTHINYCFKGDETLWVRFLLPEVKENMKDESVELTFLEFLPLQLCVVTSSEKQNRYAVKVKLKSDKTLFDFEPAPQYVFSEGSWVQVALVISNYPGSNQVQLFCREEKTNLTANNWIYIGRITLSENIFNSSHEFSFGIIETSYMSFNNLSIDEVRIYSTSLGINELSSLWPVYQNFNPDKETPPGIIIDYSPATTQRFIAGSPSIVMLDDGTYIAKGDDYGPAVGISEIVRVYKSEDKGENWKQISEIEGLTWASMFVLKGSIYMLGTSAGHGAGHVVIVKSTDGGYTWTKPTNKQNGLLTSDLSYHTAPVPVVIHNGRIWKTMEDEKGPGKWGTNFRAFLMSASIDDDLLNADNWIFSNTLGYNSDYLDGNFKGWLEGNAVLCPNGNIANILRVSTSMKGGKAATIKYNENGTLGTFDEQNGFIDFPGGSTKFHILYDEKSNVYWALSNAVPEKHKGKAYSEGLIRNTLVLMTSKDLKKWVLRKVLLYHPDITKHGFQYPTFIFDGDDIVFVARTAYDDGKGGAYKQHDANFFTFHRIDNFRSLLNCKMSTF